MLQRSGKLKIAVAAVLAVAAVVAVLPGATHAAPEDVIEFPDLVLKDVLLNMPEINTNPDSNITQGELGEFVGALDLSGRNICNITGLEYAVKVTDINLSDNTIRDISPLAGLSLSALNVSDNYLDLTPGGEDMTVIAAIQAKPCAVTYEPQKAIPAAGVALDVTSYEGCEGDTFTLTAAVSPADAANKAVTWSSSEAEIATVADGAVTIHSVGTASITATTADGGFAASCAVTIKADSISSPKYLAADGLLTGVAKSTVMPTFISNLNNASADVRIYGADGSEAAGGIIGTGMSVKLFVGGRERHSLAVIVNGDANGDGGISISDYTLARLDILSLKPLTGHYRTAADVNRDGKVSISDYTAMRLDILNLKPIGGGLPDLPEVTHPTIRRFLDIALAQQGKPYIFGDEGPNSFDCSGYVYYCLNQAGYSVGRSTANTYSKKPDWTYVEKTALQPGDLMFYFSDNPDDGDHIGHIGIYLGNGYHIHASSDYGYIVICQVTGWYDRMLSHGRRVNF